MKATDLSSDDRRALLAVARHTVCAAVGAPQTGSDPQPAADLPSNGAFVTLHRRGQLRGCIGTFTSGPSVVATIREMAAASALRDPRFYPVGPDELDEIDIEISLLTPLEEIADPQQIEVGRHGICVERGFNRGVLLPQVATENGWDRDTFLSQTCLKAGLPPATWRSGGLKIEVFEAAVFGEKSEGLR
ncbi:MAG: AmmeMemoRadiSam system protein A [Deltaproteobacteria bacterium]|nr:AmmeMemoRadiSam system protein A [Deltaproteobacteria bacterium]